jgi:ParB family chromosome partitioning protein
MNGKSREPLGKGLAALIRPMQRPEQTVSPPTIVVEKVVEKIVETTAEQTPLIALEKIFPNPMQPRKDFAPEALDELKLSIRQHGVIQPITVRKRADENYELISGERRLRASKEIGLTHIPAHIVAVENDEKMLELALIENLQREHLNPIEIAYSYQRLIDECKLTHEQVAEKIGKNRTTITNYLRLLKLPLEIQEGLRSGKISEGHARNLIVLDELSQIKIYDKIIASGLSVRAVEKVVQNLSREIPPAEVTVIKTISPSENAVVEKLRQTFGTKVAITQKRGGKGQIIIDYYSPDDLERLIELFVK